MAVSRSVVSVPPDLTIALLHLWPSVTICGFPIRGAADTRTKQEAARARGWGKGAGDLWVVGDDGSWPGADG